MSNNLGLNPGDFNNTQSAPRTEPSANNNKSKKNTKKNELKAENTTPANRYPQNILDRLPPYTIYYFNSKISFDLPLENINLILGPQELTILQFNNRNFYLFGESHSIEYNLTRMYHEYPPIEKHYSVGVDGFIRSLIDKYKKFNFELYFEKTTSWAKKEENNRKNNEFIKNTNISNMLHILNNLFLNCSRMFNKSDCEYPNLRVHHADARLYGTTKDLVNSIYHDIVPGDDIKMYDDILIKYINTNKLFSELIEKQKMGINTDIIRPISAYFAALFMTESTTQDELQAKFAGLMDYYTILRMLRDFDETKTTYGRVKHWDQKNIIGYFGFHHSDNLVQILNQLGAKIIYSYSNPNNYPFVIITPEAITTINTLYQQP